MTQLNFTLIIVTHDHTHSISHPHQIITHTHTHHDYVVIAHNLILITVTQAASYSPWSLMPTLMIEKYVT